MRKGTKKKIIHGILIIFVIIFAFLASLVAAFRDVTVQSMIARSLAGNLSKKLNTEVKVKTFYLTEKLELCLEDLVIWDYYNNDMFKVGKMTANISPSIDLNNIRIKEIYLKDVMGDVKKYEGDSLLNFKEVLMQLGLESGDSDSDISLTIDKLKIDNGFVRYWNQNKHKPYKNSMDYHRVEISEIYGEFENLEIRNDTVSGDVLKLSGKDRCGLVLDDASANVMFCEKSLRINNLLLSSNETYLDLDLNFEYNNSSCFYEFEDSVRIISDIRPSTMLLSDLQYFSETLKNMPDKFDFSAKYDGYVSNFKVTDFVGYFGNSSKIDFDISFVGLPEFFDAYMDVNIRELTTSYDDTRQFAIPIESKTVPIPESLKDIGNYSLSGTYQGYAEDFSTHFDLLTEMGDICADIDLRTLENSSYDFNISANNLKLNNVLGVEDDFKTTFDLSLKGNGLDIDETDFEATLHLDSLQAFGNNFNDFDVPGKFKNQHFILEKTSVDFPFLKMSLDGNIDFRKELPIYSFNADIKRADLVRLNLIDNDDVMLLSTKVKAKLSGTCIDDIVGNLRLDTTRYYNGETFIMKTFTAEITEDADWFDKEKSKEIDVNCDFFNFKLTGNIYFSTIFNELKNTAQRYVDMPEWFADNKPDINEQDFSFDLYLNDTKTLTKLFVPSLYVGEDTWMKATYRNGAYYHNVTIESPEILLGDVRFLDLNMTNEAKFENYLSNLEIKEIILRDTTADNHDKINIENLELKTVLGDDVVNVDLYWDDNDTVDHNKAHIISTFVPNEISGGLLTIKSEEIMVNDSIWNVNPDCSIDFQKNKTAIKNLGIYTGAQKISMNGVFPNTNDDILYADIRKLDVSDLDFITKGDGIDMDGILNGKVKLSGFNEDFIFTANIDLDDFYLNGKEVGDVEAHANWYNPTESVMMSMNIYNESFKNVGRNSMVLSGFYYPMKKSDNISFDMSFHDFKLETVSPFIDVISRLSGFANGSLKVRGSVTDPIVEGKIAFKDAGCHINYLNTYYKIKNEITVKEDTIVFDGIVLQDTLKNQAVIDGFILHDHLKDFNLNLNMQCDDFLALNIPEKMADGFWGTAIAEGNVSIKGPLNNIVMSIEAKAKKGTEITIPLTGSSNIDNSFVVFVNRSSKKDTVAKRYVPEVKKEVNEFTMDLFASVEPTTKVNIELPQRLGKIEASGYGNLKIDLNNTDFSLRGNYTITKGSFDFDKLVNKTFILRRGSSISWTGDPSDADINITGVYQVKTSLMNLGTQYADSTALTSNIDVNCIIRLSDKLMNPTISFGLELPNANEDARNIVYSAIDTTNQAVVSQQVISLLVSNSFTYTVGSNIARVGTTTGYGIITSQLSSLLSDIIDKVKVNITYTPDDQVTNEELNVQLRTQFLNDRLIVAGNFGVIRGNKNSINNANNLVGDVDLTYILTDRLSLKAYNHTNIKNNYYYYSIENYSDFTQGIGLSFSQSFNTLKEVFTIHRRNKNKKSNAGNDESVPK